ncbi:hypothetical protein ACIDE9_02315, partial [Methylophilus sp. 'Pure River']|uniref:hypothetical protein n=1 Tax=Methylophilus sp. 'Pure River' TaxID=3377117 RepID=UPI00398EDCCA
FTTHTAPFFYCHYYGLKVSSKLVAIQDAEELVSQAISKIKHAIKLSPEKSNLYDKLGTALLDKARLQNTGITEEILNEALVTLEKGESITAGVCSYNIACIKSILKDFNGCKYWLELCKETDNLPSKVHIQNDSDLENVAKEEWFQEWLNRI